MVTLKWGLAQSNNWISAWLMNQLSPELLVSLIHEFGVLNQEIEPAMSLCLGACEISVLEMVSAYTTFANEGMRRSPRFVTRIEDAEGNEVERYGLRYGEFIGIMAAKIKQLEARIAALEGVEK